MRYTDSYDDDEDEFEEAEAELMADALAQSTKNREEEIKLANRHLKSEMMDKAIFICKSNFFWSILPQAVKMKQIAETYENLEKLMGD